MNVGAQTETDYGLYFAWGETEGYADASTKAFSWSDYKWTEDGGSTMTKYNETDGKTVLEASDDAAVANWGGSWKMPTEAQFRELLNTANCTKAWTTVNGVNGRLFTSVTNGNTLFIPAAGYAYNGSVSNVGSYGVVWGSSLGGSSVNGGCYLNLTSNTAGVRNYSRHFGVPVRGVLPSSPKTPKYASSSVENRLTAISGQSEQTYIPRTVEDGQISFISDATNIQDALNKLDDAIINLFNWKEIQPDDPRLIVYYDIQDISSPTTIWTNYDGGVAKSIEVDGTLLDSNLTTTYQFDSVGEHIIKFEFHNPTIIGSNAPLFMNLATIKRVVIPDTFTSIGNNAFNSCSGLTSCVIGNGVTSIGDHAFTGCRALTSVTIGNSVISIGTEAFTSCNSLSTITSHIMSAPSVNGGTFNAVSNGGTLYVPIGSSGYETWMNDQGNLGAYNWTKVEQ